MLLPLGILASASGGADYELIATTILGSSSPSVTFTNAGAWTPYKHLQLRYAANGDNSSHRDRMRFNGDTGSNYATHLMFRTGSTVSSAAAASTTEMALGAGENTTNVFNVAIVDILDFASTSKNKTMRALNGSNGEVSLTSGVWLSTSAVTSLSVRPDAGNYITGSRFSLYGLKG